MPESTVTGTLINESLDYHLVTTEEELESLCQELEKAPIIAVDTETEGLAYSDIIVGIALSHKAGSGYYIPIRHEALDGIRYDNQLEPAVAYKYLKPVLEKVPCTGHNSKFDLKMFWKDGVDVNYIHDTLIMAHVLGMSAGNSKGLKQLVGGYLNHKMLDIDTLFPRKGNRKPDIRPKILAPEDIKFYGCEDGNWSLQLFHFLHRNLNKSPGSRFVYTVEMRLLRVVAEMESFGVPVSLEFLQKNSYQAEQYLEKLEKSILSDIRNELGDPEYEINFRSTKQLGTLLFEHLGLPVLKRSEKTGNPSTDSSVLKELSKMSPTVQSIITYRDLQKLNNTYLYGLQDKVDNDGRIRGNFNQAGTASGRFSSSNPNLQNLPKNQTFALWEAPEFEADRVIDYFIDLEPPMIGLNGDDLEAYNTEVGTWGDGYLGEFEGTTYGVNNGKLYEMWQCKTRNFIEAKEGHYLIEADYSQVELRIMAGESQEATLLDSYATDEDVHKRTAAVIFSEPLEHVTKEQRHIGKTINFSLLYGAGPYNIAQQLEIEVHEAEEIVNRYFQNLPNIKSWINRVKQDTKMDGYAETVFGRRRYFPNVRGNNRKMAEKELRESVNHHIQGAAADIMKTALVRASGRLRKHFGDRVKIVSTVHDSLMLECHNSCDPDEVIVVLKDTMENITLVSEQAEAMKRGEDLTVTVVDGWPPLEIDAKVGQSWGSSEDYSADKSARPPTPINVDELPKVRVRRVAIEREMGTEDNIQWNITVNTPMDSDSLGYLKTFLESREDSEAGDQVKLTFPDGEGTMKDKVLDSRYNLTFEDELTLRMKLGPCTIVQDVQALDYSEVLRGVDFGI